MQMVISKSSHQPGEEGNIALTTAAAVQQGSSGPTKNFTLSPYAAAFVPSTSSLRDYPPPSASVSSSLINYSRPDWRSYKHQQINNNTCITSGPDGSSEQQYGIHPYDRIIGGGNEQHNNKCSCKLLVTHKQAGAIIGKNGTEIAHIEEGCKVSIKVSSSGSFFPGTMERVMVIFGDNINIREALENIVCKFEYCNEVLQVQEETKSPYFRNINHDHNNILSSVDGCKVPRPVSIRLVVPNSAIGVLMGQQGSDIKRLAVGCGVHIQISSRINGLVERIVSITGRSDHVLIAACEIMDAIQDNPHLFEHAINLTYSQQQHRAARGIINTQQQQQQQPSPSSSTRGTSISTVSSSNDSYYMNRCVSIAAAAPPMMTSCPCHNTTACCCHHHTPSDKEEGIPFVGHQIQLIIDALLNTLNDNTNGHIITDNDDDTQYALNLLDLMKDEDLCIAE